jgi:hypothetical protein
VFQVFNFNEGGFLGRSFSIADVVGWEGKKIR